MDSQVAAPGQLNRRFDRADMPDVENKHAGSSIWSREKKNEVLREYLVFCLLRGFVLVGANLLLYKSHRGISSKVPVPIPSRPFIVNHLEPTNAILHPLVKTPSIPFVI
jgi:hypothetical protein